MRVDNVRPCLVGPGTAGISAQALWISLAGPNSLQILFDVFGFWAPWGKAHTIPAPQPVSPGLTSIPTPLVELPSPSKTPDGDGVVSFPSRRDASPPDGAAVLSSPAAFFSDGGILPGSKIVFAKGSQDPWRHASKQKSSEEMPSYLIECSNCRHCTDISGCPQAPSNIEGDSSKCSSPEAVNKVRKQIVNHIDLWLSECQDQGHGKEPSLGSRWSIATY